MNKLIILDIDYVVDGVAKRIYPVILKDKTDMLLIDAGNPGDYEKLKMAARKNGVSLDDLTKVIITHHDYDHMGALSEIKLRHPGIQVISSPEQAAYISGQKEFIRISLAKKEYPKMDDSEIKQSQQSMAIFENVQRVPVDISLNDKDILDCCGEIEIIDTSGHMPGHISVYSKQFKTLITGDALIIADNILSKPNPTYTLDMKTAINSLKKLLDYDIETIICYHGGVYQRNVRQAIEKIIEQNL